MNNIGSIVALSPALQEIKDVEDRKEKDFEKRVIIERYEKLQKYTIPVYSESPRVEDKMYLDLKQFPRYLKLFR